MYYSIMLGHCFPLGLNYKDLVVTLVLSGHYKRYTGLQI